MSSQYTSDLLHASGNIQQWRRKSLELSLSPWAHRYIWKEVWWRPGWFNPFSEPEKNLMNIVSLVFVSEQVESSIRTTGDLGKKQCYAFIADRLVNQTKSLYSPISLNKFPLFSQKYLALPSKEKQ